MKTLVVKLLLPLIALLVCCLNAIPLYGENSKIAEIKFSLGSPWGKPVLSQYDEKTKAGEWRFIRKEATLIVTKAECAQCKELSQTDIDAYNKQKGPAASAILLNHKGFPAMLRLSMSPKGENLRVFQLHANGFRYEIQMGIDNVAPQEASFYLELEFMQMINGLNP